MGRHIIAMWTAPRTATGTQVGFQVLAIPGSNQQTGVYLYPCSGRPPTFVEALARQLTITSLNDLRKQLSAL